MGSMDESPSKRRKVSPTASFAVNASKRNGVQTSPSRSSFLSPTKASLARFNPTLLPRPKSAGKGLQSQNSMNGYPFNQAIRSDGSTKGLNPVALRSTTPPRTPEKIKLRIRASTVSPRTPLLALNGDAQAVPRKDLPKNGEVISRRRSKGISARENLSASPIRDMNENEERIQSIASAQLELELQSSTTQNSSHAPSPHLGHDKLVLSVEGEPELPPTPTQLGLEEAPEPPKGLLYSSPSRRTAQKRSAKMKSSPLKDKDLHHDSIDVRLPDTVRFEPVQVGVSAEDRVETVEDPEEVRKKKTLHQLNFQLKALQEDMSRLERGVADSENWSREELEQLLTLALPTAPTHEPEGLPKPLIPISARLRLYLPFSTKAIPRPAPPEIIPLPIPSHIPIKLGDPLPYLNAFTPFKITSIDSIISSSNSSTSILHDHQLTLTSPGNLLMISLRLLVNAATQAVDLLTLVSVSSSADQELGTWIRETAVGGDIAVIGWGCGRYWEVTSIRARCWYRCCREFRELLPDYIKENRVGTSLHTQNGVMGPIASSDSYENEENSTGDHDRLKLVISRASLLVHLGRQSLQFTRSGVSLLISWVIGIDWGGEVESFVSASTSFPASWRNADVRASLDNVGGVFDKLVRERGVFAAVKVVVGLLFSD